MKILEIKIEGYKILKRNSIRLNSEQLFPDGSQVLGIIGSNGSGKTTLCSMISWLFQSIFTRKKLNYNMEITFALSDGVRKISCKDSEIKLYINNKLYYKFKFGERLNRQEAEMHSDFVSNFWGGKVVLSTFETNGEYPNKMPYNYIGNDCLIKYDVSGLYGRNSYSYPSITNGIIRFLKNSSKQNIAGIFLEQMGFQLSGKIDLKIVRDIANYRYPYSYIENKNSFLPLDENDENNNSEMYRYENEGIERFLYNKISNDKRLKLTPISQSLDFNSILGIAEDYSDFMGKYIFLNGIGLLKNNQELSFENLSSGEKFLIMRFISILSGIENDSIVIIEEPENHLNPKWRELIIPALHKATSEFNSTLIFTTHDFRIIRYLHNSCVLNISNGKINKMKSPTLLCDEFDFEAMGEKTIPFVYKDLKKVYDGLSKGKKAELLNSMCTVEEKIQLRKHFLETYEKN